MEGSNCHTRKGRRTVREEKQTTQSCPPPNTGHPHPHTHSCSCVYSFLPTHANLEYIPSQHNYANTHVLSTFIPVDDDMHATVTYMCTICIYVNTHPWLDPLSASKPPF